MSGQSPAVGTESAQTGHHFAGIVIGEGGGTTPRPYRVGADKAPAGLPVVSGGWA